MKEQPKRAACYCRNGAAPGTKVNGERKVQQGTVVFHDVLLWSEAVRLKSLIAKDFPDFEHEITGVAGAYMVIQRAKEATSSDYIS